MTTIFFTQQHRQAFTVGRLIRRPFRRELERHGIQYQEDKGWLDSQFIVTASTPVMQALCDWVRRVNAEE